MTSPVPLRDYHQHSSSLGDYTYPDTIAPSNSKGNPQSYEDDIDLYDPYAGGTRAQGKSWSHMPFEESAESAADGIHQPSLSFNTKELGKSTEQLHLLLCSEVTFYRRTNSLSTTTRRSCQCQTSITRSLVRPRQVPHRTTN